MSKTSPEPVGVSHRRPEGGRPRNNHPPAHLPPINRRWCSRNRLIARGERAGGARGGRVGSCRVGRSPRLSRPLRCTCPAPFPRPTRFPRRGGSGVGRSGAGDQQDDAAGHHRGDHDAGRDEARAERCSALVVAHASTSLALGSGPSDRSALLFVRSLRSLIRVPDPKLETCWAKACKNRPTAAEVIHRHPVYWSGQVLVYARKACFRGSGCSRKVTPCSEVT